MEFEIGKSGVHTTPVGPEHTAHAVGNPGVEVLSTPMLTLFCEIAGHNAVASAYDDGYTSVGFHNDLYHLAATPVGGIVTVTATLSSIDGRRLTLTIDGHDEDRQIVKGVHERVVVRLDEFLAGARGNRQVR
jgi:fluoroacetyl-CoA thioesterase